MIAIGWHGASDQEHPKNQIPCALVQARRDRFPLEWISRREHDEFHAKETNVRVQMTADDFAFDVRRFCCVRMRGIVRMRVPITMRVPAIMRMDVVMRVWLGWHFNQQRRAEIGFQVRWNRIG